MGNNLCNECPTCFGEDSKVDSKQSSGFSQKSKEGKGMKSNMMEMESIEPKYYEAEKKKWLDKNLNPGIAEVFKKYGPFQIATPEDPQLQYCQYESISFDESKYRYIGQTKDGVAKGRGMLIISEKILTDSLTQDQDSPRFKESLIICDFINGRAKGEGAIYFEDGVYFTGRIEDGKMKRGTLRLKTGNTYEGSFSDDLFEGKGTLRFKDGRMYTGDFVKDKMEGRGVFMWVDGTKYDGEWREGKQHGKGTVTTKDGLVEERNFDNGKRVVANK